MPTVTIVVGLVSTLLVGSAILGSLQAIKTTSLDPNVERTQDQVDQVGDKTVTIVGSDGEEAQRVMRGAIVWNMMTASDCRIASATHMISSTALGEDGEIHDDIQIEHPDEDVSLETEDGRAFKLAENDDFIEYVAGNNGNGYIGNFDDFQPLINSGLNPTCTGTTSVLKEMNDQVKDAENDLAGKALDGLIVVGGGAVGAGLCATGVGCAAGVAVAGATTSYVLSDAPSAGNAMAGYMVPGSQGDIGSEPSVDMEGVMGRMEFDVERTFLMGTNDPINPMFAVGFKFNTPNNVPGFWRGKRYSYLLPAGLSPDSFDREYHSIFTSGERKNAYLCLDDDYQRNDCPQFYERGTNSGNGNDGLYVLDRIHNKEGYTLSDPTALRVVNDRMDWILNNKELIDSSPNRRFQQKLEGVQSKEELISETYDDTGGASTGLPLRVLLADLVARGGSIGEDRVELVLEDGETLPDEFPDDDVSGKHSLIDRGSGSGSLARSHFEDAASGTQQERKKMMFYSFRPRLENVPIIAEEDIGDDLAAGCSDCSDMDRLKNLIRHTSYLFCKGASGKIQSNAGHIFSSDEADSEDGAVENQVYPKVEIKSKATSCLPEMRLSVPDEVDLGCDPEAIVEGKSDELFTRETVNHGDNVVNVVCGAKKAENTADLGGYGYLDYYVTEETMSTEGCSADWYDITADADVNGEVLMDYDYPKVLSKENDYSWSHNFDTTYDDYSGRTGTVSTYDETGRSWRNNRITYDALKVNYNASTVGNLTYRISMEGINLGGRYSPLHQNREIKRTVIVEEIPQNSEVKVKEIVESLESDSGYIRENKNLSEDFSGEVRELVIDRTSGGGITINGVTLADFTGYPQKFAVTRIEISPVRNPDSLNQNYDWSLYSDEEIPVGATQTDFELRNVESYSEPRVCKGQRGIWRNAGDEVIWGK